MGLIGNEQGESFRNADNYPRGVMHPYWNQVCDTSAREQDVNDLGDKLVPKGNGGVLYLDGEKPLRFSKVDLLNE